MIKFFRKIRQKLLAENKFSQYLIYAIGEIILVVIGILIALSINNKNNEITQINSEKGIYKNIKQQLLSDAQNIKGQIQYNLKHTKQFKHAMNIIELNDRSQKDSLGQLTVNLVNYSDFDRQGNIYETIVNSGDIKLLRNKEIIEKLRLLEETYIYLNRLENIHLDAIMLIVPDILESIRLSSFTIEDEEFMYSYKSQNMFLMVLKLMLEKEDVYNRALSEIEEILLHFQPVV